MGAQVCGTLRLGYSLSEGEGTFECRVIELLSFVTNKNKAEITSFLNTLYICKI